MNWKKILIVLGVIIVIAACGMLIRPKTSNPDAINGNNKEEISNNQNNMSGEKISSVYLNQVLGNALFELGLAPSGISAEVKNSDNPSLGDFYSDTAVGISADSGEDAGKIAARIIEKIKEIDKGEKISEIKEAGGKIYFK